MNQVYLEETQMLNYHSTEIVKLISKRKWEELDDFHKINNIYNFVQNDILFGYNSSDHLNANQVLAEGVGQCNTKATLLMALLRSVSIPCRLHAFEVTKEFQRGATSGIISRLAPKYIIHTWVEVYYQNKWYTLEGVILDKKYVNSVQNMFSNQRGAFKGYAIATTNLQNPPIDWNVNDTFIQKEAIARDYGVFSSPDTFFNTHKQHMSVIKNYLYAQWGSKLMTKNVNKIRNKSGL